MSKSVRVCRLQSVYSLYRDHVFEAKISKKHLVQILCISHITYSHLTKHWVFDDLSNYSNPPLINLSFNRKKNDRQTVIKNIFVLSDYND